MPDTHPKQILHLPSGFFQWSMKFTGLALPETAAITGCGVNNAVASPTVIAETLFGQAVAELLPFMPDDVTLSEIYVRKGSPDGTGESHTRFSASTGASTSEPATPGVTLLARLGSGLGGRRGRGRWFLPGVLEAQVGQGGVLLPAFVASYTAALGRMRAAMATAGTPFAIGHRYPELFAGFKLAPTEVTTITLDSMVASQRKRQRR